MGPGLIVHTGIITAPRPRSTVAESIRSYRAAGFDNDVLVFSDGGENVVADKVRTVLNEVRLGNKLNWMRALSILTSEAKEDEWIMVCEDDISWAVGARDELTKWLWEVRARKGALTQAGALSLYAPRRITNLQRKFAPGWHYTGLQMGRKTWGAQCYVFTWSMAMQLLTDDQFKKFAANTAMDKNIDAIVGQCVNDKGRDIFYLIPCLVNHDLGNANSSLGYKDDRPTLECDYFKGPRA